MRLTGLRKLFEEPGPWISVYLDATRDATDAVDLRLRAAWETLGESWDAFATAVGDDRQSGPHGLALFAVPGGPVHDELLPDPPPTTVARIDPLPHLLPMLQQRGEEVSWLRIAIDRTGADVESAAFGRSPRITGSATHPITKHKPGGWSAPRYQRAVEVTWERNAGEVADQVAALAEAQDAEVLIAGGDVRARQLFAAALPPLWRDRLVHGSTLDEVTERAVAAVAQSHLDAAIEAVGVGPSVFGIPATVEMLQRGQVHTLLLDPVSVEKERLWVGAGTIATSETTLRDLGVADPREVDAGDALIYAAARTGAELYFVDDLPDITRAALRA